MFDSAHTREIIYPLLRFDLSHYSRSVTVDHWVSSILNVPPETIADWSKCLGFKELLHDSTSIMENLRDYCYASLEPHRYTPWSTVVNKIVSLAPGRIEGLPDYPLTLRFARSDPVVVGGKGQAQRKPNVVVIDKSFNPKSKGKSNDSETPGIGWKDIVACVEFKKNEDNNKAQISDPALQAMYQELKTALEDGPGGLEKASDDIFDSTYLLMQFPSSSCQ